MNKIIFPSTISGKVAAPASKSFFQRAVALAILCQSEVKIYPSSHCDDALAAMDIARRFGCTVTENHESVMIDSGKASHSPEIYCGEAGLGFRMFAPLAALYNQPVQLIASGSLLKRPAAFMQSPFEQLGVTMESSNGFPPITVTGPIKGGNATLDGSLSSQFLTGLLISLPKATLDSHLKVTNLTSKPYIDMTIQAMQSFGVKVENKNYQEFLIKGNQSYEAKSYQVEGDWSGAAGLLIAGAIGGQIEVAGLNIDSFQADREVLEALKQTGAGIIFNKKSIRISKVETLKPFQIDATDCPDLFPVLTALAANCKGISKIKGVHRLTHKESNRALSLKNEFNKIGVSIEIQNDIMSIQGGTIHSAKVFSHHDHRIAMALVLAAINANGAIEIEESDCVNKSYPEFYSDMELVGIQLKNTM